MTAEVVADPLARRAHRRPPLPSLTGGRWWAAFAVFILHALVFLPVYPFQKSELFKHIHQIVSMQLGAGGVTFFFILSGFLIFWSFPPGRSVSGFYRRRLLKIYPTHIIALVAFVLIASVPLSRTVVWVPNLLLVHTWIPRWTTLGGLNVPSWSLCAELIFYLTFPMLLPLIRRIRSARLWWALAGVALLILVIHTAYYVWVPGPKGIDNVFVPRLIPGEVSPQSELHASPAWFAQSDIPVVPSYWLSYNFPLTRLPEFFLGVLAGRLVLEGRWRWTGIGSPLVALGIAFVATSFVPINYKMSALFVVPMTAVIATMAARDLAGVAGLNSSRPIVWLGEVSYAFYLIQFPVMVLITKLFIGGRQYGVFGWLGWSALALAGSVMAGALIYHYVDGPIMRRFAGRRG